jgi:hypothetical protein
MAPSDGMNLYTGYDRCEKKGYHKSRGICIRLNISSILLSLNMTVTSFEMPPKSFDRKINNPLGVTPKNR